jgi:RNA ligase (TIGR02306 family)
MSTFACNVTRIKVIEPIEGADAIELAVVGDYRSVIRKGTFEVGDLAVYIPEAAVLPISLIDRMGLTGRLAGKDRNRVKAIRLRGCLSQGLVYSVVTDSAGVSQMSTPPYEPMCFVTIVEGEDVASILGIVKYEPIIPAYMSGEVYNAGQLLTVAYDIENVKKYPDVLIEGEEVVFTEKLHGTFCGVGILPEKDRNDKHIYNRLVVFSKGLGTQGLCFTHSERNQGNVYFRALEKSGLLEKLRLVLQFSVEEVPFFVLGEVYGRGVQDLGYGSNEIAFRVFDIISGYRGDQRAIPYDIAKIWCEEMGVEMVPLLYRGPYTKEIMLQHTSGMETVSGNSVNIREGIVVKPTTERRVEELGRVILKSISAEYLLRNGDITEYQ